VTTKEWQLSFDKEGRMIDVEQMKERIFRGGLESNTLRREVWKYLLNYYPWSSSREERTNLVKQRQSDYSAMKLQWKSMNEQQRQKNASFRDRESLIGK
jgi:predicted transcriptional regulator with HTH domain